MKKLIIAASMVAVALTSNAQDTYKFAAGDNNFELASAPFSGNPLAIPYIKYRRFLSESLAFRIGVNVTMTSRTTITTQNSNVQPIPAPATPVTIDLTTKESSFGWELAPGIEKHFAGTERLSPYVGAELRLAGKSQKNVSEFNPAGAADKIETLTIKNGDAAPAGVAANQKGFFALGLNLVAGADYYFAKRLYLGGEFAYGLSYTSYADMTIETSVAGAAKIAPTKQGSAFGFGAGLGSLAGKLKIGFLF